ncbi:hypothetical protein BDZ97DRAFT_1378151 [Flammula alnicola]|nr:hypothetical protein BDZ97DRAFT_1378151 [Flammula alnicola]
MCNMRTPRWRRYSLHLIFFWSLCDWKTSDRPVTTIVATNAKTQDLVVSSKPQSQGPRVAQVAGCLQLLMHMSMEKEAQLRWQAAYVPGYRLTHHPPGRLPASSSLGDNLAARKKMLLVDLKVEEDTNSMLAGSANEPH